MHVDFSLLNMTVVCTLVVQYVGKTKQFVVGSGACIKLPKMI